MYEGFWYKLKNAFRQNNNSLYKIIAINLLVFFVLLILRVFLKLSIGDEIYNQIKLFLMMPASIPKLIVEPWTLVTYMFTHEDFLHILFNLLFLYWFGLLIHEFIGSQKLANIYLLGGIAGGLMYLAIFNISPIFSNSLQNSRLLGASAGVTAIVVAAATISPNTTFFLFLLGPVKIKFIAIFFVLVSFYQLDGDNAGGNLAHLGGAALGFVYVTQLRKGRDLGAWIQGIGGFFGKLFSKRPAVKVTYRKEKVSSADSFRASKSSGAASRPQETTQEEIDQILDKIAAKGYDALSKEEKRKLFEFSKK